MQPVNLAPNERIATMDEKTATWVVYLMTIRKHDGMRAVCEQVEWDAMERARPGYHQFIQGGFTSEAAAELIARGYESTVNWIGKGCLENSTVHAAFKDRRYHHLGLESTAQPVLRRHSAERFATAGRALEAVA
jgi:hypothetical protein